MRKINKEILALAIPNILSNVSVPLLSTVDTALMGRLSDLHIGAVGVGAMIFNFIYWNFGFLRMGTTGMTAQAFGKQDEKEMMMNLSRPVFVALILAFVILILQYPIGQLSIQLMKPEDEVGQLIWTYFRIRIWAAPATLLLYVVMGWFFGMQNAIYPLILTIFINLVNIALSYVLVFYMDWEIRGVAWGTVVAQYAGLALGMYLFWIKYRRVTVYRSLADTIQWSAFKAFLVVNRDIFIRTFFLTFAFGFFYAQSSDYGSEILAVNVVLLLFVNWMSYAIDGFAFASESLVGKYHGAKNQIGLDQSIRLSFVWALVMAVGVSLIYWLFGDPILSIFTDQQNVIEAAKPFIIWMILLPVIGFWCYIWDGVFIGLTASVEMRNTMAIALVVYLLSYLIFEPIYGNHGLWLALIIFLGARGVFQYVVFKYKKMNKV